MDDMKLSLRHITHWYETVDGKKIKVLDDINLDVKKGEFLAIVGSSGCGKSTLLNVMSAKLAPTQGTLFFDGLTLKEKKHKIGYISQSDTLLPWRKIIDNVALGLEIMGIPKKQRLKTAKELMETGGLKGFENKYPFELSGGMRKRAIILRALAQDPDIIFMDEPFGPLDVFTREMLQEEILRLWNEKKVTIVYVTHDIAEAISLGDRIILMSYRPSTIKQEYDVRIPRPRNLNEIRHTPEFEELENRIWEDIREEVMLARESEMDYE